MYLFDTNVCIALLNNSNDRLSTKFYSVENEKKFLCSIVIAELYYGVYKSKRIAENLSKLRLVFSGYDCLDFDETAAEIFGRIRTDLYSAGTPIGPYDMQIAAIALANDLILITNNTKEFSRIASLKIEDWSL